jgi:hypothetical protein
MRALFKGDENRRKARERWSVAKTKMTGEEIASDQELRLPTDVEATRFAEVQIEAIDRQIEAQSGLFVASRVRSQRNVWSMRNQKSVTGRQIVGKIGIPPPPSTGLSPWQTPAQFMSTMNPRPASQRDILSHESYYAIWTPPFAGSFPSPEQSLPWVPKDDAKYAVIQTWDSDLAASVQRGDHDTGNISLAASVGGAWFPAHAYEGSLQGHINRARGGIFQNAYFPAAKYRRTATVCAWLRIAGPSHIRSAFGPYSAGLGIPAIVEAGQSATQPIKGTLASVLGTTFISAATPWLKGSPQWQLGRFLWAWAFEGSTSDAAYDTYYQPAIPMVVQIEIPPGCIWLSISVGAEVRAGTAYFGDGEPPDEFLSAEVSLTSISPATNHHVLGDRRYADGGPITVQSVEVSISP